MKKTTVEFKGTDQNAIEFYGHFHTKHSRAVKIYEEFKQRFRIDPVDCLDFKIDCNKSYYHESYSFNYIKPNPKWQKEPEPSKKSLTWLQIIQAFLKKSYAQTVEKLRWYYQDT